MLIIFDLDDTLIDTSGALIPLKLRAALQAMIKAGLKINSQERALATLLEIDSSSPNGKETLMQFLDGIRADSRFLEVGVKEYYGASANDFIISMLPSAAETLTKLHEDHDLVLITSGDQKQQQLKMKKAGINSKLFRRIIICDGYSKKAHYRQIMEEFKCKPTDIIVCGDKFDIDLLPAKELGMTSVHMLWGRALRLSVRGEEPDYRIRYLPELLKIVGP